MCDYYTDNIKYKFTVQSSVRKGYLSISNCILSSAKQNLDNVLTFFIICLVSVRLLTTGLSVTFIGLFCYTVTFFNFIHIPVPETIIGLVPFVGVVTEVLPFFNRILLLKKFCYFECCWLVSRLMCSDFNSFDTFLAAQPSQNNRND